MDAANEDRTFTLSVWDARQRVILYVGAVYAGSFGVLMLFVPAWATGLLGLPFPDPGTIWLRLDGIFLLVMAMIYLVTARDPARYLGNVGVALIGKAASIVFYFAYVFIGHESKVFIVFAVADIVMFYLHYWALGPRGLKRFKSALQPARPVTV